MTCRPTVYSNAPRLIKSSNPCKFQPQSLTSNRTNGVSPCRLAQAASRPRALHVIGPMGLVHADWRKPHRDTKPHSFGHSSWLGLDDSMASGTTWRGWPLAQYHAAFSDRCHELLHRIIRRTIQATIREGCVLPVEGRHRLEASASRCCKSRDDPTGADQDSPSLISVKVGDEQEGIGDTIYLQFSVEICMGTRSVRHS
jgi:hypothetical protein